MPTQRKLVEDRKLQQEIALLKTWLENREWTHTLEAWTSGLRYLSSDYNRSSAMRMSILLTTYCGWQWSGTRTRVDGDQVWVYYPPATTTFDDILG